MTHSLDIEKCIKDKAEKEPKETCDKNRHGSS